MIFEPFNPKNHIKIALKNTYFLQNAQKNIHPTLSTIPLSLPLMNFFHFWANFCIWEEKKACELFLCLQSIQIF
jgi:hypothetical protein